MKKLIDARGLTCPLPVIETRKALKTMTEGQLEIVVDNEIALQNLEKMAQQMSLAYRAITISEQEYRMDIFLSEAEGKTSEAQPRLERIEEGTIVVISSQYMGEGDPILGKILMKGFVYTLTELDHYPSKVLLYNSGVKLATTGSDSIGDLQKLAEQGVEILSCGTCLDFYQLTEELQVGGVTNMYEIAQSTMGATRIIQP